MTGLSTSRRSLPGSGTSGQRRSLLSFLSFFIFLFVLFAWNGTSAIWHSKYIFSHSNLVLPTPSEYVCSTENDVTFLLIVTSSLHSCYKYSKATQFQIPTKKVPFSPITGRAFLDSIAISVFALFYLSLTNTDNQEQEPKEL